MCNKMIIYRIELEDGFGPYRSLNMSDDLATKLCIEHCDETHYSFSKDGITERIEATDFDDYKYFAGFTSMVDLEVWFDGFLEDIYNCGGKVISYNISSNYVIRGLYTKQVAFVKHLAQKIA